MSKTKRKTDYLFQRPGSANWYIKLQAPDARIEKSLGTSDRRQAEILALPMIAEHKARLLAARPRLETTWQYQLEPGREHVGPDGERIIATERELIYLNHNGAIVRTVPNGSPAYQLVGGDKLTARSLVNAYFTDRPKVQAKSSDDTIIETYLKHASITGHSERETRTVWALYKQLTDGKPLKEATRDDGRKIVQHFEAQGLRSATIQKKITWLNAAVNLAIKESKLTFNPFSSIVPKRDDKQKRLPLSEADIKNAKRELSQLDENDQLLFRLLAATGMRLSEAFEIDSEMKERGCRYVIIGKKTPQSHRRVPFPAAVLPYLPNVIKGPLFAGGTPAASKRLNKFIRRIGIGDKGKVLHSLRHRAQDRLRAAGCPVDYRWALLGHEEETVAEGYGLGFPVPMLRKWIDKIGF
jgi:integrase